MTNTPFVPLARKWRPRSFADVVGQEEIVRALTNAVSQERLAHAYLFSGPRGVGKTTSARLLAASINCHASERPTPTPCGTCASCVEVLEGRSIDTLEIDGATHGKVDQARELIEIVSFAPARDRRKVFIIDEVHAISSAAFQALLKTLEEPPSHAVFILATTERHKIPATILSRCQRFDFRRLTDAEVADRLAEIARREGIAVGEEGPAGSTRIEPAALLALGAAATGSVRDGLSLLDQVVSRAGSVVTAADVAALLGAPDRTVLTALLAAILEGDRPAVLAGAEKLESAGSDPRATLRDLTALVRGAVRMAADPSSPPPSGLSEEGSARVAEIAKVTPYPTLLRILSILTGSDGTLRRSDAPSLVLEVLLLRLTELPSLVPIEELLAGTGTARPRAPTVPPPGGVPPAAAPAARKPAGGARKAESGETPRFVGLTPLSIEPDPPTSPDPAGSFRDLLEKRNGTLSAVLEDMSIRLEGKTFRVVLDPPNAALERRLAEPAVRKILEEAAIAAAGKGAQVVVEGAVPSGGDLAAAAAAADPKVLEKESLKKRAAQDERLKKVVDLLGGQIADVRKDEGER